jgi:hypothetical protein
MKCAIVECMAEKKNAHSFRWKTGNSSEKPSCGWDSNIKILGDWVIKVRTELIGLITGFNEAALLLSCLHIFLKIGYRMNE